MKFLIVILLSCFGISGSGWLTNFEEAKHIAQEKHGYILLNFSGSDWCGPCMRLKKVIFENETFENFAMGNLVLVNADFPRNNKNKLSNIQVQQNERLAEKYNSNGKFPLTLLLNSDGSILRTWEGLPDNDAGRFVQQLKESMYAAK